jgi:hypothetical protein
MTAEPTQPQGPTGELAFYYPGHVWLDSDWVKNLLLFFDGIALLVPEYKRYEVEQRDPVVAGALSDAGLLHVLPADVTVDADATKQLADAMEHVFTRDALNQLDTSVGFHSLSFSRVGWFGSQEIAARLLTELRRRNLARESEDGFSIPMHPAVRVLILTFLAQILRANAASRGVDLAPATDRGEMIQALTFALVGENPNVSAGDVVASDLETVGVDLSVVPMNELLDFRAKHLREHREYARVVRQFVRDFSAAPLLRRDKAFEDRRAEIRDLASDLRELSRKAWKRPVAFALGVAGTAAGMGSGPVESGILGILGAIAGYEGQSEPLSAYSYLFRAAQQLR